MDAWEKQEEPTSEKSLCSLRPIISISISISISTIVIVIIIRRPLF